MDLRVLERLGVNPLELERNEYAERSYNDALAQTYFDVWDTYPIQIYTRVREAQLLAELAQRGDHVLVVGVGGGRELPTLFDLECSIVAIDVSPAMLQKGRERFPDARVTWQVANANSLADHSDRYDLIVALGGVVNYLLDIEAFLRSVYSLLNPGGRFLFDSFNSEFIGESPLVDSHQGRVRRPYSVTELRSALLNAGFDQVSVEGIRFVVDLLPAKINKDINHPGRRTLERLLELEEELSELLAPNAAKLLLCHGQRVEVTVDVDE